MPINPLDEFVQFDDLEDGLESSFGDELNARFEALKIASNISFRYQKAWSNSLPYKLNDVVKYSGVFWIAKTANTNSAPTDANTNWEKFGGTSLPNGGTTGQFLAKQSSTNGDAGWANAPSSNAPAQNQKFLLSYAGTSTSPIVLSYNGSTANITAGASTATQKTNTATMLGGTASDVTIDGSNTAATAGTPAGYVFSSGSSAAQGFYAPDGTSSNGQPTYRKDSTYAAIYNGTRYQQKSGAATLADGPTGATMLGTWTAVSTAPTVTAQAAVAATPANVALTFELGGSLGGQDFAITTATAGASITPIRFGSAAGPVAPEAGLEKVLANVLARIATLQTSQAQAGALETVTGINGPQDLTVTTPRSFAVDTSTAAFTQPVPTSSTRVGQQYRFTKTSIGTNTFTLTFQSGEGSNYVLNAKRDTVTIQAYLDGWYVV